MNEPKLDQIEIKLLQALQQNCRRGLNDIASAIGSSASSLWRRLKNLEERGVIERYSIVINHRKMGIRESAYVHVRLEKHNEENIEKFAKIVLESNHILECNYTTGEYDFVLKVISVDMRQFHKFLRDTLMSQDYISHTHTTVILDCLKENSPVSIDLLNG
ncbi:MAG: Lrp/AsnC family transcriptional regulator [Rhizobiales bacterium]|nr:Lrp/AsnC family transcriptional regulator [Hyphomicrobiales bacterium]